MGMEESDYRVCPDCHRTYDITCEKHICTHMEIHSNCKNDRSMLEKQISDRLCEAMNLFNELDSQHPSEMHDFVDGIHKCQYVLGMRILRRDYPEIYPMK